MTRAQSRGIVTPGTVATTATGYGATSRAARCSASPPTACRSRSRAADGGRPALAVLHVGWRGLLAGIVAAGVARSGRGTLAAVVGPAIGPCCYEVGEEVAAPCREAFGADVVVGRKLDLWTCVERALRAARCAHVERVDRLHRLPRELFFSASPRSRPSRAARE